MFEKMMASPPVQLLFVALIFAIIAIIWLTISTTRSANKNMAEQDKQSQIIIANNARLTDAVVEIPQSLRDLERSADDNYLAISTTLKHTEQRLLVLISVVEGFGKQAATYLIEEAALHAETRKTFRETARTTLLEYTEIVAQQRATAILGVQFQFPLPDDPRWQIVKLRPASAEQEVKIFKLPIWHDGMNIGVLAAEGEVVRCITHTTVAGFYAIQRLDMKEALNGWIDLHAVTIDLLTEQPETSNEETLPNG